MTRRPTLPTVRSGYTLIEILLALAVLLIMAAMVWPPIHRLYANYRLKQAAEMVRVKVAGTRIRALDSGLTYQFRFEPGGTHYVVIPYELEAGDDSATGTTNNASGRSTFSGTLPDGLRFDFPPDQQLAAERLTPEWLGPLADSYQLEELAWSPPLLFYPDGTATQAAFDVIDSAKQTLIRLSVRDLTGVVSMSRVETEEYE